MTVSIIQGNARHLPLADNTVDLVVTSPPYFALRSYQDGGEHYDGQIGSEPTPAEFVAALLDVTRECVRVLKPSGSLWVNLGDKYAGSNGQQGGGGKSTLAGAANGRARDEQQAPLRDRGFVAGGAPTKSLIGIPWRYALACIDDLGLILRAEVIWSKPNGLPESVTDRVRRSHEQWFHFTLEPRYYSAVDEIRESGEQARPQASRAAVLAAKHGIGDEHRQALLARGLGDQGRSAATQSGTGKNTADVLRLAAEADAALGSYTREFTMTSQTLGKLPGSVWTIPTEPLTVPADLGVDHFAAFPTEWPRRIIQGWSPAGVCTACGEGRRPVADAEADPTYGLHGQGSVADRRARHRVHTQDRIYRTVTTITGYACACPEPTAPTTPGVVLDPFGGTGTTALVADVLGRHGISVDMSADYCRLAQWRTTDPGQRAKAARVEKPPVEAVGQMDLFDMEGIA